MPLQRGEQHNIVLRRCADPTHHHTIQSAKSWLMVTETFTDDSLDSVAHHSRFSDFARNSQAEAGMSEIVGTGENGKITVAGLDRLGENAGESVPTRQSGAARKACAAGHGIREPIERGPWRGAL